MGAVLQLLASINLISLKISIGAETVHIVDNHLLNHQTSVEADMTTPRENVNIYSLEIFLSNIFSSAGLTFNSCIFKDLHHRQKIVLDLFQQFTQPKISIQIEKSNYLI